MHIAIVTDAWAPQVNGVVRTLLSTVGRLRERGHVVTVVEPSLFAGITLGRWLPGMRIAFPRGIGERLDPANVVHIATEGPLGHAAKLYCDSKGIPYTTAYHTNFPAYLRTNFRVPSALTYRYLRWFHGRSRAVLVPSMSQIGTLAAHGFKRCRLWGRGVDTATFHSSRITNPDSIAAQRLRDLPRPLWLNVGRVSKEKGLDDFLKLDLPGTKIVVGEGPDLYRLSSKYPDAVFLGKQKGKQLAAYYRLADVFVFPSKFDTFGLVNIEAIACGTPVAAYPVTGPIDIVEPGITGYLDEDLKKACLLAFHLAPFERDFSWDKATDQFVDALIVRTEDETKVVQKVHAPYDFLPPFG